MSRILRDVRIVLQSERLIARRHLAVIRTQTGLLALGGAAATLGVVMLNVAGFYALRGALGGGGAALLVALIDFLLAMVLLFVASRIDAEDETRAAVQVRDMAIADIEREIELASRDMAVVRAQLGAFARDPGRAVIGGVVEALIALLGRKSD